MQIVTGHTGEPHVTPVDDSVRNVMVGKFNGRVVLPLYERFSAYASTANAVRVYSGYGMNQGRLFKIDRNTYDTCVIENGTAGMKRCDLIVARYTMTEQTGVESIRLEVLRGETGNDYVDPAYQTGDLMAGAIIDDMPLYRVKIDGIVIVAVEPLFEVYDKVLSTNDFTDELMAKLDGITEQANKVAITQGLDSGTLVGTVDIDGEKTNLYAPPAAEDAASKTWVNEQIAAEDTAVKAWTAGQINAQLAPVNTRIDNEVYKTRNVWRVFFQFQSTATETKGSVAVRIRNAIATGVDFNNEPFTIEDLFGAKLIWGNTIYTFEYINSLSIFGLSSGDTSTIYEITIPPNAPDRIYVYRANLTPSGINTTNLSNEQEGTAKTIKLIGI